MMEYERRLLERIANNLKALRDDIHAIREYQQAHDDADEEIQPFRVEITQAPDLDPVRHEFYAAENRERNSAWGRLKPWVEGIAVAIALALAIFTYLTLREVKEQTTIAEQQSRPWIKIVDIVIAASTKEMPALSFMTMPMAERDNNGKSKTVQSAVANISLEITIKNIGKGVARNVYIGPVVKFYKWNTTEIPSNDEQQVCSTATKYNPGVPFSWSAVFPDETRKWRFITGGFYDESMFFHPADRPGNWISGIVFGCVVYQPSNGYRTSAVFDVMGGKDRFVEVGKPLVNTDFHLLRDDHYEDAH